jgi:uncharacterized membrane protein
MGRGTVKKSLHAFTRVIWGLLAAYVLINIVFLVMGNLDPSTLPQDFLLQLVQSTIYVVVLFGAAATLIELVDQIRWNGLSADQRAKL